MSLEEDEQGMSYLITPRESEPMTREDLLKSVTQEVIENGELTKND